MDSDCLSNGMEHGTKVDSYLHQRLWANHGHNGKSTDLGGMRG